MLLLMAAAASLGLAAAPAAADAPRTLADVLADWGEANGATLVVPSDLVRGTRVGGEVAADANGMPLDKLLSPFGLTFQITAQGAIVIRPMDLPAQAAPPASAPVRLEVPVKPDLYTFSDLTLDRIYVTTQLRLQRLADVPVSVTAISGRRIEREDLTDIERVSQRAPGFVAQRQTDASPSFVIRGVEAATGGAAAEPSISIFADGFDISRWRGSNVELLDIDRIEIVKGPQGTLFGRGAQIGAVAIHTRRADPRKTTLSAEFEAGSEDLRSATGVWNQPLLDESAALRLAVRRREQAGYRENLFTPDKDVNDDDLLAARLSAAWEAGPDLRLDLVVNHQFDRDRAVSTKAIGLASPGGDLNPTSNAVQNPETDPQRRRVDRVQLFAAWDLAPAWTLDLMTGHRQVDLRNTYDPDGTSFPFLFNEVDFRQSAMQHQADFRFDDGGRWRATFGASAFHDDSTERNYILMNEQLLAADFPQSVVPLESDVIDGVVTPLSTGIVSQLETANQRQSHSVYGNVSVDLTQALTVDTGLRLTWDDAEVTARRAVASQDGIAPAILPYGIQGTTFGQPVTLNGSDTLVSPRIALTYALTRDLNTYVSYSEGSRAGFPQSVISNPAPGEVVVRRDDVEKERMRSLEAGLKGRIHDAVSIDLAAFHFRQNDLQTFTPSLEATNAGSARGYGLEASTVVTLADGLDASASYAWLDTRYDRFAVPGLETDRLDLSGNRFRLAPEHTFNAALDWEFPISASWDGFASANYSWQSDFFFNNDNLPDERQEAFGLLDARLGLETAAQQWRLELYADNLLDEKWVRDIGNSGKFFGISTAIPADPRVVGVRIAWRMS